MMCFTTGNSYSWEKVLVPDSGDKKTKSPWNFSENFENEEEGRLRIKTNKFSINNKGEGLEPFRIKKDPDGNKYLEVTVKDGWNTDYDYTDPKQKRKETERAEFQTIQKRALDKEMWISFKTRLPQDFTHIDDRVLFFQFKNQFERMKRSPLLGIRFYKDGNVMKLGGETGGNATKSRSKEEKYTHWIGAKYKNREGDWRVRWEKDREDDKNRDTNDLKITTNDPVSVTPLGEWSTYKIGIYNTRGKDGFVKVYKDNELMFDYEGITYDWRGRYTGSYIRIGIYRQSGKNFGIEYPDQTIHFDDFIVVSDEKTLDQLIRKH
jgi:hypothetical protein